MSPILTSSARLGIAIHSGGHKIRPLPWLFALRSLTSNLRTTSHNVTSSLSRSSSSSTNVEIKLSSTTSAENMASTTPYMSKVSQILCLSKKKSFEISPEATVFHAVEMMVTNRVGSLIVLEKEKLAGIFTERDYLTKLVLQHKDPEKTLIKEVMTTKLICVTPNTSAGECMKLMSDHSIRHLPIIDEHDSHVISVLSIRDILFNVSKDHEEQVKYLEDQVVKLSKLLSLKHDS